MIYVATIIYDDEHDGLTYSGNMPLPMTKMAINRMEKIEKAQKEKDDGKVQEDKTL